MSKRKTQPDNVIKTVETFKSDISVKCTYNMHVFIHFWCDADNLNEAPRYWTGMCLWVRGDADRLSNHLRRKKQRKERQKRQCISLCIALWLFSIAECRQPPFQAQTHTESLLKGASGSARRQHRQGCRGTQKGSVTEIWGAKERDGGRERGNVWARGDNRIHRMLGGEKKSIGRVK